MNNFEKVQYGKGVLTSLISNLMKELDLSIFEMDFVLSDVLANTRSQEVQIIAIQRREDEEAAKKQSENNKQNSEHESSLNE